MEIQAFFWDYDNTILETAEAHWNKHQVVLGRYQIELNETHRKRIYENNGNQNWKWIKDELGLTVPEADYLKQVDAEFQRHMVSLEMRPGVDDLFKLISQLGVPQAIITNARKDSAEPVLRLKNISSVMKFILFKEDYEGRKPDATPYLEGFKRMEAVIGEKIIPRQCVAVEDDPKGVESAHKAGAIVIHRKLNESEPDCQYADYTCYHKDDFIKIVQSLLK